MRVFLLIAGAVVLPLVWGWVVYRLLQWLWPLPNQQSPAAEEPPAPRPPAPPFEYQI